MKYTQLLENLKTPIFSLHDLAMLGQKAIPSQISNLAKKGDIIDIKAIVQHDMESGFRRNEQGEIVPRDILRSFLCHYNGVEVFRADFHPGTGANPMLIFSTVATETGSLEFKWSGDNDYLTTTTAQLTMT